MSDSPILISIDYVTPLQYGAVGDGVTDDTNAFQRAFDTGKPVFVPVANNQLYKINNPVTVYANGKMFSEVPTHQYEANTERRGILLGKNGCFNCSEQVSFQNVNFRGPDIGYGTFIRTNIRKKRATDGFKDNNAAIDSNPGGSECIFDNCNFRNGKIAIESRGRADIVRNCFFAHMSTCVKYVYPEANIKLTDDTTVTNTYQQFDTGARSMMFNNNKIHNTTYGIVFDKASEDTSTNIPVFRNFNCVGNTVDVIRTFIKVEEDASLMDSVISSNSVLYIREHFLGGFGKLQNVVINNNSIRTNLSGGDGLIGEGTDDNPTLPKYLILFGTAISSSMVSIIGNTFYGGTRASIALGSANKVSIVGNTFNEVVYGPNNGYISHAGILKYCSIIGNVGYNTTESILPRFIHGFKSNEVQPGYEKCRIEGNSTNAGVISNALSNATNSNIQSV